MTEHKQLVPGGVPNSMFTAGNPRTNFSNGYEEALIQDPKDISFANHGSARACLLLIDSLFRTSLLKEGGVFTAKLSFPSDYPSAHST
ncbi:uncharacterized protein EI90DRAFT_906980 [Cantharellus anzutake]|uniref:uncharacterized protein n=1 Tax=Cantharellus anzutake TaxID=1750568 RepID=UPI001905BDBD|nr:uncharacterized protein EI90DRAFT_906980 [Cantharellus anzutake]KAF8331960.1 hypothetical protein EI90DRAFT_906980 [Cantharellus anzutake]